MTGYPKAFFGIKARPPAAADDEAVASSKTAGGASLTG